MILINSFAAKRSSDTFVAWMCMHAKKTAHTRLRRSADIKAEDLVVNEVAGFAALLKQECLGEFERLLLVAIDEKLACNENEDAIVDGRLVVNDGVVSVKCQTG